MAVGKIGNITYTIYKEPLNDEIVFRVPVTNISDKEQCFILKVFDEAGIFVAKAPTSIIPGQMANKIKPGLTEVMALDSRGDFWHINKVAGQTLSFKLFADQTFLTTCGYFDASYTEDDTKEFPMKAYYEDVKEQTMWTILFIIIIAAFILVKFK